jgi:hypothetical protein
MENMAVVVPVAPSVFVEPERVEDPFLSPTKPAPTDPSTGLEIPRPVSKSSRRSDVSGTTEGKREDGENSGIIIIGMDNNDAATMGRTETTSRGSSREMMDPRRPSDTTDATDHEDLVPVNNSNLKTNKHKTDISYPRTTSQRSNSSSSRAAIPVLIDRRRSTSMSSTTSSTSNNRSTNPAAPTTTIPPHPRQPSSLDPPDTDPTTIRSSSSSSSPNNRPSSATEFQKFRQQLHSTPSNPAFHPDPPEWQLHPNPHHPNTKTEILRIERVYTPIALPVHARVSSVTNYDVLIPRFGPAFPPILREYGIGEAEWSGFVGRVNKFCMEAFDPFRVSNILVNVAAVMTFWLSEWVMPNLTKRV